MAEISVEPITEKDVWEVFMAQHPEANFLHSWFWADFHERLGHRVHRCGFFKNGQLVGVMLAIVENAKRGRHLIVPAGPIIDWEDSALAKKAVAEMKRIAKREKCVFIRVRPQIVTSTKYKNIFRRLGFVSAQMHLHAELTSQLDITKDESSLLAEFRKNTRYELKQADKRGIKISSTTDVKAIEEFYMLQLATARRHGFVPYGKRFLQKQFETFAAEDKVLLYSAHTKDGKLIAQAFIIFYNKEAAYHYGASTDLGRKEPGAYAIQWAAIQEAKRRGCERYNFWGVVQPDQTKHRFYGVSVFKRGFRGEDVEYLHAQDLVINRVKYIPNFVVEYARKRRRHL
ncbi:MAG TPA: peptidoglycan bridge formation glycyltransferase FemA/FemB family protein [Candidatus Saccharibacteria bacterium]|nr:peptidoglycan bridge formation glycyltransferase FemA/FemB family protein [Candidatus Saccharibacteria bacterium]